MYITRNNKWTQWDGEVVGGKAGVEGGREKAENDVNIVLMYDFLKNEIFHIRAIITNTFIKPDTRLFKASRTTM